MLKLEGTLLSSQTQPSFDIELFFRAHCNESSSSTLSNLDFLLYVFVFNRGENVVIGPWLLIMPLVLTDVNNLPLKTFFVENMQVLGDVDEVEVQNFGCFLPYALLILTIEPRQCVLRPKAETNCTSRSPCCISRNVEKRGA